jgi:hypothetical protein
VGDLDQLGAGRARLEDAVLADQAAGAAQLSRVLKGQEPPGGTSGAVEVGGQLQALTGPRGGRAGRTGRLQVTGPAPGDEQRPGRSNLIEVALEPIMQGEQSLGRPQDGGLGRRVALNWLERLHHAAGRLRRSGRRGGDGSGDPDVPAHQRQGAELAQGPLAEPLLGVHRVLLGLLDEAKPLLELAGLEAAGAGEQGPGGGQLLLDQPRFAHGLPGDGGSPGKEQAEQQHDEQTTHDGPPSTIHDRR